MIISNWSPIPTLYKPKKYAKELKLFMCHHNYMVSLPLSRRMLVLPNKET